MGLPVFPVPLNCPPLNDGGAPWVQALLADPPIEMYLYIYKYSWKDGEQGGEHMNIHICMCVCKCMYIYIYVRVALAGNFVKYKYFV